MVGRGGYYRGGKMASSRRQNRQPMQYSAQGGRNRGERTEDAGRFADEQNYATGAEYDFILTEQKFYDSVTLKESQNRQGVIFHANEILRATAKAVRIAFDDDLYLWVTDLATGDDNGIWIPKSVCLIAKASNDLFLVWLPRWFVNKNEMR